ncbi:MAG: cell division protein FtsK [Crocinitomicaceae bacterium]|nr:cell division protein FtsK [Crocinitomicaceae bacterium]
MKIPLFNSESSKPKKPVRNVRKGSKDTKSKVAERKKKNSDLDLDIKKFSFKERWEDERFRSTVGIITLGLSLFFFISIISSMFTGSEDLLLVTSGAAADGEIALNEGGNLGAYVGYYIVRGTFGLGTLILPFMLLLLGVRWLTGKNLLPLGKSFKWSLAGMIIIPWTLDFFFRDLAGDYLIGTTTHFMSDQIKIWFGGWRFILLPLVYLVALTQIIPGWQKHISKDAFKNLFSFLKSKKGDIDDDSENLGSSIPETSPEIEPVAEETLEEENKEDLDQIINDFLDGKTEQVEAAEEKEAEVEVEKPSVEKTGVDLALEVVEKKEETTLSDNEHRDLVQDFGEYDPKLELSNFKMPGLDHLVNHGDGANMVSQEELSENKDKIIETLQNFKIEVAKISAEVGPTVTLYEIVPAPGIRISKIKNLEDDIALSLSALGIRIIAPIPGKGTIGIEVPNSKPDVVSMRALISSDKFQDSDAELPIAMGKTISNETHVFDLAKMPHLLMAGATGQGKSVGLNAMLVSMLYRKHPSALKFVLVDPKKVELSVYNHISRHYLAQLPDSEDAIITDTDKVVNTLNSLCKEMDQRYELLKDAQCRNIKEYNKKFINRKIVPESSKGLHPERGHHYLPYIVLVVDEFADLIMTAGKEVETPIARLAQLARAIGIHLIIATQRPSVNIITGTIKANFPARVAFRVTSKIDSRTILDAGGADQLIGRGDMLMSTGNDLIRLQCGFVDTPEVESICDYIGGQRGYETVYELPEFVPEGGGAGERGASSVEERDVMFEDAARVIVMHQQGSTSLLQRKLKLGYNRAGRIVDQLEDAGIIGPFEGSKARKVLIPDEVSLEQLLIRIKSAGDEPSTI